MQSTLKWKKKKKKTPHENLLTKPSMSQTGRAAAGFVRENINVSKTYGTS